MKKILFVSASLGLGGSEKCMAEMIRNMDLTKYDITILALIGVDHCFSFDPRIRVINGYREYEVLNLPLMQFVRKAVERHQWRELWHKIRYRVKVGLNRHHLAQDFWQELNIFLPPFLEEYDVVIGYGQGAATYFTMDKVHNAGKKILWVNTDLEKARYNIDYVRPFYVSANMVVTDSQHGTENVERLFPAQNKVCCFPNMLDTDSVLRKAEEYVPGYTQNEKVRLLTVGRLCEAKALHLAIKAAAILKKNHDITWYIIGEGALRGELEMLIKENGLEGVVMLPGLATNPYPWFLHCDIYVQTSIYEGSCMTINEAMVFAKPIVTTNFPAAYEKIRDGENGLICEMTPESIAQNIEILLTDKTLRNQMKDDLRKKPIAYGEQMKLLDEIIGA